MKKIGVVELRRADEKLNAAVITGAETLIRGSVGAQALSAADPQDVNLPDATTLPEGWQVEIFATGASALTVYPDSGSTPVAVVAAGSAVRFKLLDNGDEQGEWFAESMDEAEEAVSVRHVQTFNDTTDWGSPSGGLYTITVTAATHGRVAPCSVTFFEDDGGDYVEVEPNDSRFNSGNGDHSFNVWATAPDDRFTGRAVYTGDAA